MPFQCKRIYDAPAKSDGFRVLVDRLWPRGLSKEKAAIDLWAREIAPSDALRKRFHGHPERWEEFCERYAAELEKIPDGWRPLAERARRGRVTLLFAAREPERNNAVALRAYLEGDR
ncbi:MAG TPA: DUF488 family protein [Myxococcota bacterium]|jgi:uncharacterized protein YeaO (DUF488 family)|nr:DUF488 family protein [Myxococcota bacterium]